MNIADLDVDDIFVLADGRIYYLQATHKTSSDILSSHHVSIGCLGKVITYRGNSKFITLLQHPVSIQCSKYIQCIGLESVDMRAQLMTSQVLQPSHGLLPFRTVKGQSLHDIFTTGDGRLFAVKGDIVNNFYRQVQCIGYRRKDGTISLLKQRPDVWLNNGVECRRLSSVNMRCTWQIVSAILPEPHLTKPDFDVCL